MAIALAIFKAVAAAFTVAPWLRTTAFVLIAFSFGFVRGCNTGRSWAKQPEPTKIERPIRRPILPWREAEVQPVPDPISTPILPQLPPIIEAATVPVAKPAAVQPVQRAANCSNGQCGPVQRRGFFGRWR
tara:strand:- start:673 stop:1062 length:390 start_codon:yes stop_codon:yes gene_type:complete